MTVILDPPKVDSAKTTSGVLAVARPCYTVNNVVVYDRNVLTVPRMYVLQTGQSRSLGEHWSQETRCPQGRKTVLTSLSMQTLHVFASWSRRFSSISICSSSSASVYNTSFTNNTNHRCLF